ncbi:MAG: germination protein YpeB [Clostridia bacterium]|nr:germination protein YpeB [Clostridia bacterium]
MKNRTILRILCFLITLCIVLAIFLLKYYKRANSFQNEIKYTYSRSFEELYASLNKINVALDKAAYVSSANQISKIATDIYTESKIAKQAFSQLPTGSMAHQKINKFFSQVGNYSIYVANKVISGTDLVDEERDNLEKLSDIAKNISNGFSSMQITHNNIEHWTTVIDETLNNSLEEIEFVSNLNEIDNSMADYPTLLYDGPYSDYLSNKESELIKNSEPVDETTARQVAAKALGITPELLTVDNYDSGNIPAINFVYNEGAASVSINGGFLISFRKYNFDNIAAINYNQALIYAQNYLKDLFNKNFIASYYYTDNGVCVIDFALKEANVICYTDLIKVGVDMSSGDIVFFESRGYLINHKERTIETPKHSLDEAAAVLNTALGIKSSALTLIPTSGGYEKLCYEFLCSGEHGEEILIYINAETLNEEQIFMVLKTNGGTLVK